MRKSRSEICIGGCIPDVVLMEEHFLKYFITDFLETILKKYFQITDDFIEIYQKRRCRSSSRLGCC